MTKNISNNQIDIIDVSVRIIRIIKQRKVYIITFTLIGFLYGLINLFIILNSPDKYESLTLYKVNIINKELIFTVANTLKDNFVRNSKESFSKLIKINQKSLNDISFIDFDTVKKQDIILIKIRGKNSDDLKKVNKSIMIYLNTYFKSYIETKINDNNKIIQQIQNKLDKTDNSVKNNNNIITSTETLSKNYIYLFEEKLKLENELSNYKSYGIIGEISSSETVIKKNNPYIGLITYTFLSAFLTIVIILFVELVKKLNAISNNLNN